MASKMIVNAIDPEEVRIAILDGKGVLEDFVIETRSVEKNKGNIYKAIVTAVEPALNAAFVNYGAAKEGFLTAGDVDPAAVGKNKDGDKSFHITDLLKPKQTILVQVEKEEVGAKGAVLTTYLSLAGRYVVVMPGARRTGVSRRIESDEERRRMREAADKLNTPDGMGVIIRTAGKDRTKTDLNRDLKILLELWTNIQKESSRTKAPALILKEQDVIIRSLRDHFGSDIDEIIVDSDEAYDRAAEYMHLVMPKQSRVLSRYVERRPIFHHYRVEQQLEVLFSSKVLLPSGGSIVVEPTEALVSVDVNSGKQKHGRQEETALKTNLEAAKEVARQLRLRDLGGIIVIDFIDMMSRRNNQAVEKALKTALKVDKARIKVGRVSPNGTLELTRQRLSSALRVSVYRPCGLCNGSGHILSPESHALAVLRRIIDRASRGDLRSTKVRVEPEAANLLLTDKWSAVQEIERRFGTQLTIIADKTMPPGQDDLEFETDPDAVVVELPEPDFGPPARPDDWEEDEEDEEDEDQEGPLVAEAGPTKKRKRRRRRGRGGQGEAGDSAQGGNGRSSTGATGGSQGLPAFELIDLAEFRGQQGGEKSSGGKSSGERSGGTEGRPGRRRKRRRRSNKPSAGGRGRAGAPSSGGAASKPAPQQKPAAGGGVGGFFRKLFGMGPKT